MSNKTSLQFVEGSLLPCICQSFMSTWYAGHMINNNNNKAYLATFRRETFVCWQTRWCRGRRDQNSLQSRFQTYTSTYGIKNKFGFFLKILHKVACSGINFLRGCENMLKIFAKNTDGKWLKTENDVTVSIFETWKTVTFKFKCT